MKFELTDEQVKKFDEWRDGHEKVHTTINGRYNFIFSPSSIGTFVSVEDGLTSEILDLNDYDKF